LGGSATTQNVRLLCRFHNELAARNAFGDEWMDQFTRNHAETEPSPPTELPVPTELPSG